MADYRGIFSLQQLYEEQQSDNWAIAEESSFTKPPYSLDWQYGYFSGGDINPGSTSIVDRVDYSNDLNLTSRRGNLSQARYNGAGTGNKNYAWNGGGYSPPSYLSIVDRIDYSNDTATAAPKGPLTSNKNTLGAVGNEDYGYYAGGYSPSNSPVRISTVDRVDYSNDTPTASPKGPLSQARTSLGGTGTLSYGYFGGGDLPGSSSRVDRIDYSNDTATASTKGDLAQAAFNVGAVGNNNYGYWTGGYSPPSYLSYVSRLDYASDSTTCVTRGPLTTNKVHANGVSNSSYGWLGGGYFPSVRSDVDRIDFANDTSTASPRGSLSIPKFSVGASSAKSNTIPGTTAIANQGVGITTTGASVNSEKQNVFSYNYGYHGGGYSSPPVVRRSSIDRIDYANDTTNLSPRTNFATPTRQTATGLNSPFGFGYAARGYNGSDNSSNVDRIDFSNDTSLVSPGGNLSVIGSNSAPLIGNGFGYVCGGSTTGTPGYTSNIERLDFSNDTANLNSSLRMTEEKGFVGGTGTRNFGYIMGGFSQPGTRRLSTIERLDYSNDTAGSAVRATASEIIQDNQGLGSASHGYACGTYDGSNNTSKIFRIDYANDTAQASYRANILLGTTGNSTSSTLTYGYLAGGEGPTRSNMQRFDYANDTVTTIDRGNMTEQRGDSFGVSSLNQLVSQPPRQINDLKGPLAVANTAQQYAYWGGGYEGAATSDMDRIDFANDTNEPVARANLPDSIYYFAGFSSQTHGYMFGGSAGPKSITYRLDYSNDSVAMAPVGNMPTAESHFGATNNLDYGWMAGSNDNESRVYRLDFTNDTWSQRGDLSLGRKWASGTGNMNYGYFGGGASGGGKSTIDRVDYSNDGVTASPKGPLAATTYYSGAAGNADYGYWGGGSPARSYCQRLDFANDTATALLRGAFSAPSLYYVAAEGNKNYGYWGTYAIPGNGTAFHRVDYANDTVTQQKRTFSPSARSAFGKASCSAASNGTPQG